MIKRFLVFVFSGIAWMASSSIFAQTSTINEVLQCTIKPGYSVDEIVTVGRAIPRNENGPNLVFYREPIVANPSRAGSINVVRHWDNFEHLIRGLESQTPSGPGRHFFTMVDCAGTRAVARVMGGITEQGQGNPYQGGDVDLSYVAMRQCELKPGNDMQDVQRVLRDFDQENRQPGDRSAFGFLQMIASGQEGLMNSSFIIRIIGQNPTNFAKRLDSQAWNVPQDSDPAICGNLSLWRSHVIHWGN